MAKLKVEIISPEKVVFKGEADALTIMAEQGQVTILPKHIPLFTKVQPGEVNIKNGSQKEFLAVSQGYLTVEADNRVTILTDYAIRSEEIEVKLVQAAKQKAEKALKEKKSRQDFVVAEAELRKALLQLKVAHRKKSPKARS